ncbi:MAG: hypothetical protein E6J45_11310 [Chloroflexi bacterium]|nr:MAG: hypothetical protein E6J45_11310 [Chloroflexota bacterium]
MMNVPIEAPLPHPLFCGPCPHHVDRMDECPGFVSAGRPVMNRAVVLCRYFTIEETAAGPAPGCVRHPDAATTSG